MKKTIELLDGTKVVVAAAPPQIYDDVNSAFPDPEPPIRETETAAGEKMRWYDEKDPDYRRALSEVQRRREEALADLILLWGLPEIKVPTDDDWLQPIILSRRLLDESWQPPADEVGRRLLYIRYVVLANAEDALRVRNAIAELSGISEARVKQIEESFRHSLAGSTGTAEAGQTEL
jgi:hypothetical protein